MQTDGDWIQAAGVGEGKPQGAGSSRQCQPYSLSSRQAVHLGFEVSLHLCKGQLPVLEAKHPLKKACRERVGEPWVGLGWGCEPNGDEDGECLG